MCVCLRARVRMLYFIDVLYNNVEFDSRANIKRLIVMIRLDLSNRSVVRVFASARAVVL